MAFRDYSLTPASNTTLSDGTYVGPNMLRNKVRPAIQQLMADGRELYETVLAVPGVADAEAAASAIAAGESATDAAASATTASADSTQAGLYAAAALALTNGYLFDTSAEGVSQGVISLVITAAGSGGTNGTFPLAFSGGGGSGAAGTFTVSGGAVTAVEITDRGKNYTSDPTASVAASSGLTGATVTPARGNYAVPDGEYYLVKGSGSTFAELWKNVAGVATSQALSIPSLAAIIPVHMGYDNLYSSANDLDGYALMTTGAFNNAGAGYATGVIPVTEGDVYAIRFPNVYASQTVIENTAGIIGGYGTGPATGDLITGIDNKAAFLPSGDPNVWLVVVPTGQNITHFFLTSFNPQVDQRATLIVRLGTTSPAALAYQEGTSEIGGGIVVDRLARTTAAAKAPNPWYGQLVRTCGDSVTAQGGWQSWLAHELGCNFYNDGSDGARSGRLVSMMTNGRIANRQEATNFGTLQPAWDTVSAATVMIGTNDLTAGLLNGSSADIPAGSIYDVSGVYSGGVISTTDSASTDAYFDAFPDTFWGNVGLCIEYALWKNPRLHLVMLCYPHRALDATRPVDTISATLAAIAEFYSLPFLSAESEGGVPMKNVARLTALEVDTVGTNHLNDLGKELFGKWLARKLIAN
jgi:hypothetical protein